MTATVGATASRRETASRAVRRLRPTLPPGIRGWLRPLLAALLAVAFIGGLAVFVFPTSTWIDQQRALDETGAELTSLAERKEALAARVVELDTDDEIESLARSQYGLVKPGEEAYAILPAPVEVTPLPDLWPFAPAGTDASGDTDG